MQLPIKKALKQQQIRSKEQKKKKKKKTTTKKQKTKQNKIKQQKQQTNKKKSIINTIIYHLGEFDKIVCQHFLVCPSLTIWKKIRVLIFWLA